MDDALNKIFQTGLSSAIPEGELTVSKWAEMYRHVSLDRVADPALAGKWKNSTTPYLVGIMDAVTEAGVNEILFLKSSQVGGTELINNVLGYYIHIDPATIQYVCENEGKARAWSVESFAPMIRDTPVLKQIFGEAAMRDSSNMIEAKAFRGGHFALGWATSPATLSSRPRRVILTDETDAFEPTKEGDPVKLAEARTKTAGTQRKIIHVTTPRDKETSRVLPLWENSTQERYFVPCPNCDAFQILVWKNVFWGDDPPEYACYVCEHCGELIENSEKAEMVARGRWESTSPEYSGNRRAFWINEIYSPFTSWGEMAVAFLEAKKHRDTLKVFTNTRLAEFWEEKGEQIEYADLTFKREEYEAEIPAGVLVLTVGVDVQDDRLEIEIVGWGRDWESWSIDYHVIYGSPALPDVWDALADYLLREWESENGKIFKVRAACIDSGGHHTQQVYRFCKANAGRRWFAIKGANISGKPLVSKPSIVGKNKVRLFTVGTDTAKDEIFSFLKVAEAGSPGYCHFPESREETYFKQLCAEKKITKYVQGVAKQVYIKVSESARNEALDVRVYATAARQILNPNIEKMARNSENSAENDEKSALTRLENETLEQYKERLKADFMKKFDEKLAQKKADNSKNLSKKRAKTKNSFISTARKTGNFANNW